MSTKKHTENEEPKATNDAPANPGHPESPTVEKAKEDKGVVDIKPEKSKGIQAFDIESHKLTELFKSSDVVFTREGGAGELRAQPAHEAKTRFAEVVGDIVSEFKDHQTTVKFKLKSGHTVTQTGHKTTIVDKDGNIDDSGPRLNIHAADFQG